MSSTAEEFYRQRDLRTIDYLGPMPGQSEPVGVAIDADIVDSPAAQLLLLSLANQLARVHRRINFFLPSVSPPLAIPGLTGAGDLFSELFTLTRRIDPFGEFRQHPLSDPRPSPCIGIGSVRGCDIYVGWDRSFALVDDRPISPETGSPDLREAALASCLGASAMLRMTLGLPLKRTVRLSGWTFEEGDQADSGPDDLQPVDVGSVLLVGAGAVASALVYWLHMFGVSGKWTIVDRDDLRLHNTNRGLLFFPEDSDWGSVIPRKKVDILGAYLPGARRSHAWYHEAPEAGESFDVVLCLANDYDVRTLVARRLQPVVLHATTGRQWTSCLFRHIAGRDDCIRCGTRDLRAPSAFTCSTGALTESATDPPVSDSALPFLSAAAGLMLAVALQRLQAGVLEVGRHNHWVCRFDGIRSVSQVGYRECQVDCEVAATSAAVLRKSVGQTQWARLDPRLAANQPTIE